MIYFRLGGLDLQVLFYTNGLLTEMFGLPLARVNSFRASSTDVLKNSILKYRA
jgi:hypothetical protein